VQPFQDDLTITPTAAGSRAAVNNHPGPHRRNARRALCGAVVGPSFLRRRETWLKAGSLDALSEGEPTPVTRA